jgi:hypothetical protein
MGIFKDNQLNFNRVYGRFINLPLRKRREADSELSASLLLLHLVKQLVLR